MLIKRFALPLFGALSLTACIEVTPSEEGGNDVQLGQPNFASVPYTLEATEVPYTLDFNWILNQDHESTFYTIYVNGQSVGMAKLPQADVISDYSVYQSQIVLKGFGQHSLSIQVCRDEAGSDCAQSKTRIITITLPNEPDRTEQHDHDHDMNSKPDTNESDTSTEENNGEQTNGDDSSNNNDEKPNNEQTDTSNETNSDNDKPKDNVDAMEPDEPKGWLNTVAMPFFSAWNSEYCLTANEEVLTLDRCNDSTAHYWKFVNSKLVWQQDEELCAHMGDATVGRNVSLEACETASYWEYLENGSLVSNNLTLDVNREQLSVIAYTFHGGDNQRWINERPTNVVDTPDQNDSPWAQVSVLGNESYGTREFWLPAAQNWANTGLYLRRGQQARIQANGMWQVKSGSMYGPEGHSTAMSRGCAEGELVARLGLYYKDDALTCIGQNGTITAHEDGILFVGAVVSNDLGETYEARKQANGSLLVTVSSEAGETVPTIWYEDAGAYNFNDVASGWVEIKSEHNILTLPVATAKQDASELFAAGKRLDDIYKQHKVLRGKAPYHDQPIRWFPDTKDAPGWMLAGNPVRMDPALVDKNGDSRISIAGKSGQSNWGFAHELGHNFNFSGGDWYYTTFGGLEAWPNIFTMHSNEALNTSEDRTSDCPSKKATYVAKNQHEDGLGGAWNGLCFLMEFTDAYGWQVWKNFYADFDQGPNHGWQNMKNRMDRVTGTNTASIFKSWNIPVQ